MMRYTVLDGTEISSVIPLGAFGKGNSLSKHEAQSVAMAEAYKTVDLPDGVKLMVLLFRADQSVWLAPVHLEIDKKFWDIRVPFFHTKGKQTGS